MSASHKHQYIFIHMPKVAGSAIKRTLSEHITGKMNHPSFNHSAHPNKGAAALYHLEYGDEMWKSYFKFSFVRNPWDRMVSGWKFKNPELSLDQYIDSLKTAKHSVKWHSLFSQCHHLKDLNNKNTIDFVGRFETLEEDVKRLFTILQLDFKQLWHINPTKRDRDYQKYYNDKTRKKVQKMFKDDIEKFDYSF